MARVAMTKGDASATRSLRISAGRLADGAVRCRLPLGISDVPPGMRDTCGSRRNGVDATMK